MNRDDPSVTASTATAGHPITPRQVTCVSHGFQSNYERGFCNGLASVGVDVTLIGSDRTDAGRLDRRVTLLNLRGSQDEGRRAWQKAINLVRYRIKLLGHVFCKPRAIVHVIGLIDSPLMVGVLEGAWLRAFSHRYVLTVHNLLPHDRHTTWRRFTYRLAYALPHRLVVHTERMKDDLRNGFGVQGSRVVVMEHGIEPAPTTLRAPGAAPSDEDVPTILLFGKVAPYKGIDLLLSALRTVSFPYRLVIAGACPSDAYRDELKAIISGHPQRARIRWNDGFVSEGRMESLFNEADLVALPYRHIDQSGVLFQALRFGVPVLATEVGQFDTYVTSAVGVLAAPNNVSSLTTALEQWSERRSSYSREDIRRLGAAFNWSSTVLALRKAYQ